MKAALYCRVSTDDQEREGTSLQTQRQACIEYAGQHGYQVEDSYILDEVFSGLRIDRPKLRTLLDWVKNNEVQAVVIYSSDRFSRKGYDLLTLIRECDVNDVELLCVSEDLGEGEVGELINFVRGWASGLEAHRITERTMRGKKALAQAGNIPSGFGRYRGHLGLRYDKKLKKLVHIPGQIDVAAEILHRVLKGESSSQITRDLQARDVRGASGGLIHRSSVNRVMANARSYAGIITWSGIEIKGKVEDPIITEADAAVIADRIQQNKEKSYGFGKRKWLTGRVYCGICGRRFNLDSKKGCLCNGADNRSPAKCPAPKVGLTELSALAYGTMIMALSDPQAVIKQAQDSHDSWERQKQLHDELVIRNVKQQEESEKRRRLLSFQHEVGGITDVEYLKRLDKIKKESVKQISY